MAIGTDAVAQTLADGVSHELALTRVEQLSDVEYSIDMTIPANNSERVTGSVTISFLWHGGGNNLQIDFQGEAKSMQVNGRRTKISHELEHIIIPSNLLKIGKRNSVQIGFTSLDGALNRNGDYMYTLFVPDHARSAFPCFDQPDIKARFTLSLTLPADWTSISNAPIGSEKTIYLKGKPGTKEVENTARHIKFLKSDLLPTYLFSFTAGRFNSKTEVRDGREITALYRETDPKKVAQLDTVFGQVAHSLKWLEQYTGIKQPFQKYGVVVLPGYQFGGMEHPGCIQLRDRTIFLGDHPTQVEEMNRLNLVAHETSHLWFGDLVTMRWFDDVWTKEVFANFMADKIAREQFPDINHDLNFIKSHYPAAISTDRTRGTHPIQQRLDNLNNAGLLYGNIIYHKAPIMMRELELKMGESHFRKSIQTYLNKYAFGNATWDDLIAIMDQENPAADIKAFDSQWVKGKGLPQIELSMNDGDFDPFVYGHFQLTDSDLEWLSTQWYTLPEAKRYSAMMYIYESWIDHHLEDENAFQILFHGLCLQDNPLVASTCCNYLLNIMEETSGKKRFGMEEDMNNLCGRTANNALKRQLLQNLGSCAISPLVVERMYQIWQAGDEPLLNEHDYMAMAYHLAITMPDKWKEILQKQRERLSNDDLKKEFDFVSQGCNPDTIVQQQLFNSLLKAENRIIEPFAASLLSLLNDPQREPLSNRYILSGLEALEDIQRTGDIFFPLNWCNALLGGHHSKEAAAIVNSFLNNHPQYPEGLRNKLLQAAYRLTDRLWSGEM